MAHPTDYAVVRVHDDSYRLDRLTPPGEGAAAFVIRVRDRLGNPLGWRLKPLAVMQGAKSRIWPQPADPIASTKLMSPKQTREAVRRADDAVLTVAGGRQRTPAGRPRRRTGGGDGEGRGRARAEGSPPKRGQKAHRCENVR